MKKKHLYAYLIREASTVTNTHVVTKRHIKDAFGLRSATLVCYIDGIVCMQHMRAGKQSNAWFRIKRFGLPKWLYHAVKESFKPMWVAMYSGTGSEIASLSVKPDLVITSNKEYKEKHCYVEDTNLYGLLSSKDTVTLHGWMKIVPPLKCKELNMFNGHPGLITKFPELKGKDPQARAVDYEVVGSVIHRVTAEVDSGEILFEEEVKNSGEDIHSLLRETSRKTWEKFIAEIILSDIVDTTENNGGPTSYYDFEPGWEGAGDIIEAREMNFNQGSMFKSTFCFNIGRHKATHYERELNKIVYFANRELKRIKDGYKPRNRRKS